ncbi:MAG: Vms1/Ankzf1 family peptidyl-tRNA hydrolase [Clostridia bacterium]
MLNLNLKELAEITAPERSFWSIYLSGPHSVPIIEKKIAKIHSLMKNCRGKEELEYFDENARDIEKYLQKNPVKTGPLGIFACKQLNFFQTVEIPSEVADIVWIDACPYIRPLAEFYDEYENVAVVVADNEKVQIYLVSSSVMGSVEVIKGNIKNHVKVGGWSQQRYERRRDNQLTDFAHEIRDALLRLDREEKYGHILLVGGKEILNIVYESMPKEFQDKIIEKNLDLSKGEGAIHHDIMDLLSFEEQRTEQEYWEHIHAEYLRGGLAAVGIDDVLQAAKEGRVEKVIIDHALQPLVERCQNMSSLGAEETELCTICDSPMLFKESVVNELLGLLIQSGSEFHFATAIPELAEVGGIAAFLRY